MGTWVKTDSEMQSILDQARADGKKVVTTNGCFDILHLGHLKMLEEAKAQGDVLVVGVNSDSSIKKLKGPQRPIRSEKERVQLVAALAVVDYAILFDEMFSNDFVARIKPDVHVNDATYGKSCVEAEILDEYGGRLHLIEKFPWESNTELLARIRKEF